MPDFPISDEAIEAAWKAWLETQPVDAELARALAIANAGGAFEAGYIAGRDSLTARLREIEGERENLQRGNERLQSDVAVERQERHGMEALLERQRDEAREKEGIARQGWAESKQDLRAAERTVRELAKALEITTLYLSEAINGYKLDRSAAWLRDNGFVDEEPDVGSLAALLASTK